MTTLREAAQRALEALNLHAEQYPHMVKGYTLDAENALRAALAEPDIDLDASKYEMRTGKCSKCGRPLHPNFPCAEIAALSKDGKSIESKPEFDPTEQSAGSPQTDAKPERVVVACRHNMGDYDEWHEPPCCEESNCSPVYLSRPREWQGLTDEEIKLIVQQAMRYYGYDPNNYGLTASAGFIGFARAIEQVLKERNV